MDQLPTTSCGGCTMCALLGSPAHARRVQAANTYTRYYTSHLLQGKTAYNVFQASEKIQGGIDLFTEILGYVSNTVSICCVDVWFDCLLRLAPHHGKS